ncbi:hypothetical protein WR25_16624 [Diploscapter pachys]|uniref:Protein kinase domain-containing protein n=1 Tax=Diploscapter pachys TaxID=2018661 RepID=A0A2A2L5F8_9BILA|nr:hypothetical protein WR25_16624 [Diploscapter pachys]
MKPPDPEFGKRIEAELTGGRFGVSVIRGIEDDGHKTCANGLPIAQASVRMLGRLVYIHYVCRNNARPVADSNSSQICRIQISANTSICFVVNSMTNSLLSVILLVVFILVLVFPSNFSIEEVGLSDADGTPNTVAVISEIYPTTVANEIQKTINNKDSSFSSENRHRLATQSASALAYLHSKGIVHGLLSSSSIYCIPRKKLENSFNFKLSQYGFSHITECGSDAEGAVCCGFAMSPERLASRNTGSPFTSSNVLIEELWPFTQYVSVLQGCVLKAKNFSSKSLFSHLVDAIRTKGATENFNANDDFNQLIESCLLLNPSDRPQMKEILDVLRQGEREMNGVDSEDNEQQLNCRAMPRTWLWLNKSINGNNTTMDEGVKFTPDFFL